MLRVVAADLIAYRFFDFAHAVDLVQAENIWRARAGRDSKRGVPDQGAPGAAPPRVAR